MRSYNNLYEKILQDDYIRECFKDAAKKKTKRRDVKKILENLDAEVRILMKKWIESYGGKKMYVLKMDIHHFFESIDRTILKEKLREVIRDRWFYRLLCVLMEFDRIAETVKVLEDVATEMSVPEVREFLSCIAFDDDAGAYKVLRGAGIWGETLESAMRVIQERRKGVPLGYFTSQWFGNFYRNYQRKQFPRI